MFQQGLQALSKIRYYGTGREDSLLRIDIIVNDRQRPRFVNSAASKKTRPLFVICEIARYPDRRSTRDSRIKCTSNFESLHSTFFTACFSTALLLQSTFRLGIPFRIYPIFILSVSNAWLRALEVPYCS